MIKQERGRALAIAAVASLGLLFSTSIVSGSTAWVRMA